MRQWCGFHSEVMSCMSDNKLQMEAVASPLPCMCVRVCGYGIYVLTFLFAVEGSLCTLQSDL